MVQLFPKVKYCNSLQVELATSPHPSRTKRAAAGAMLLGFRLLGATGMGTSALILQDQNYKDLRLTIEADLKDIESSMTKLEESLTSLTGVALQNRRGLAVLFLQQGGLCAALGEECCFFVYHSRIIKKSIAQLRKRMLKMQNKPTNYYENLFN